MMMEMREVGKSHDSSYILSSELAPRHFPHSLHAPSHVSMFFISGKILCQDLHNNASSRIFMLVPDAPGNDSIGFPLEMILRVRCDGAGL